MTNDEANRVAQALQPLNQFVTTANMLNTTAGFHALWQQAYTQCVQQVAQMVDKPSTMKPAPQPPAPGKQGSDVAKKLVKKLGKKPPTS